MRQNCFFLIKGSLGLGRDISIADTRGNSLTRLLSVALAILAPIYYLLLLILLNEGSVAEVFLLLDAGYSL